jgi:hypothetical protein
VKLDQTRLETDAAYRDDMRHRFITDWFFACELLGRPMHRVLHAPIADLYPRKNPNLRIDQQDPIKNRMLLDPRFSWKTTGGRIEKIQWLAAFPADITMLNETATQPLAREISDTIAGAFYSRRFTKPTQLQQLFPEIATDYEPFTGKSKERWSTPARLKKIEESGDLRELDDSVSYTSPQSVQSGWHPWIINADDMVESKNSGLRANPEVRQGIIDLFDTNKNTLVPGGYMYLTGTRYHPFDLYGVRLKDMDPRQWKVVIRSSLERKDGSKLLPGEFPDEDEVILHFPDIPGLDYQTLREKFYDNYETFMCQQQNSPQGGHVQIFDDALYDSCEIDEDRVPTFGGEVFTCWRLPFGKNPSTNKYAEGVCARIEGGKVYITDCWRWGGTPSHQAEMIVQCHRRAQADGMLVLCTPGSNSAWTLLHNEAAKKNLSLKLRWAEWDDNENYRTAQIKQMEPLLKVGRVLFQRAMTKGSDMRSQFVHFGLIEDSGLIECAARLADHVPLSQLRANMAEEELEWQRRARERSQLADFLGQQGLIMQGQNLVDEQLEQKATAHVQAMNEAATWKLPPLPGGLDG